MCGWLGNPLYPPCILSLLSETLRVEATGLQDTKMAALLVVYLAILSLSVIKMKERTGRDALCTHDKHGTLFFCCYAVILGPAPLVERVRSFSGRGPG